MDDKGGWPRNVPGGEEVIVRLNGYPGTSSLLASTKGRQFSQVSMLVASMLIESVNWWLYY